MTTKNSGLTCDEAQENEAQTTVSSVDDNVVIPFPQVTPALNDEAAADSWLNNPDRTPLGELPLEKSLSIVAKIAADSWLKGIDRTPFTQLPFEVRNEVMARRHEIQLVASTPSELYQRLILRGRGITLGPFLMATPPPLTPLERLYSIFGDAVLIPVKLKSKKPVNTGWNTVTFADTQETAYQDELEAAAANGGNIGIVLGPSSGGIASIDIDRDLDRFLQLNPLLSGTTRTKARRGCQFFTRLSPGCSYPNSKAVYTLKDADGKKYGEWRCGGGGLGAQSVIFGVHPDGMSYQFIVDNPPETIDWNDIQLLAPFGSAGSPQPPPAGTVPPQPSPADLQQIYADLFAAFGDLFIRGPRGSYSVNQPFFARFWGSKRLAFYDRGSEDFYEYNAANGAFERLRHDQVIGLVSSDIFTEAFARGFQTIGGKVNAAMLNSIINLIKADPVVCRSDFFALDLTATPVIHAANGMVAIENDKAVLYPFDPKYRSRNRIPINYVEGASCVNFKTRLLEPVLSTDDIELLQRYCGLILIGGNRAQMVLMMLGGGGTGKGTITRLLTLVIGSSNVIQLRVDQLTGRFETANLIGKLLLNVVEATANYLNREGAEVIKALVGHDRMSGEKKYRQELISFNGDFPVIVTSNEALNVRLSGDETAQSRRFAIIEFPQKRPSGPVIEHFEQLLYDQEGEGIFAWMIEGAIKHWKELKSQKKFSLTATQEKRVDELIGRSKSIETLSQPN